MGSKKGGGGGRQLATIGKTDGCWLRGCHSGAVEKQSKGANTKGSKSIASWVLSWLCRSEHRSVPVTSQDTVFPLRVEIVGWSGPGVRM